MSTQELLTFLFNAIALGFALIAAIDFGTRLLVAYKQVSIVPSSPLTAKPVTGRACAIEPTNQLPMVTTPQVLPQLPDPWLLPLEGARTSPLSLVETEQKHLRLLPQAKETSIAVTPTLEDLLFRVNKLTLRKARKLANLLGITQKVNGRDQKLEALKSQIKLKLQQAKSQTSQIVKQELLAS